MAVLLVVHHSPTAHTRELTEAVLRGATHPDITGVRVVVREALSATIDDVLAADGYLLGTTANLGYISGALKHFFDTVYEDALEVTRGRPFGSWIHGSTDTTGARAALERIITGLRWTQVAEPVDLVGRGGGQSERCSELGATLAALLMDS
ncbi:MAG: flavodoxin family protein [Microthrixaceae bacterium]|nr:flavodoxin family protein [Microthrixaceae bacterium]